MNATGWDTEWEAEKAFAAMKYLADFYSESAGSEALHGQQDAAHAAAVAGNEARYLEALRQYMRAGRSVALGIRKGAA
jgi:hypothetical protein